MVATAFKSNQVNVCCQAPRPPSRALKPCVCTQVIWQAGKEGRLPKSSLDHPELQPEGSLNAHYFCGCERQEVVR